MTRAFVVALLLSVASLAQSSAPVSANDVPQRKEIFNNNRVTANRLELAPGDATPMHTHEYDMVDVFVNGGKVELTLPGRKSDTFKLDSGEVRFKGAGYTHSTRNLGTEP